MSIPLPFIVLGYLLMAAALVFMVVSLIELRAARRRAKARFPFSLPGKPVSPIRELEPLGPSLVKIVGATQTPEMKFRIENWKQGKIQEAPFYFAEVIQTMGEIRQLTSKSIWPHWEFWAPTPRDESIPLRGEKDKNILDILCKYIIDNFWDKSEKTFRQTTSPFPETRGLYPADIGIRLCVPGRNGDAELTPSLKEQGLSEYVKPSIDFIKEHCRLDPGFSDIPGRPERSNFANFSALAAWRRAKSLIKKEYPDYHFPTEGLKEEILSKKYTDESDNYFAFKYKDREPCLSATFFTIRALTFLGEKEQQRSELVREALSGRRPAKLLAFIKKCWREEKDGIGGFSWNKDEERKTVMHTRFALQVIRLLLGFRLIERDDLNWLQPAKILRFLESCRFDGGFCTYRENGVAPLSTLSATRAALNVIKLLEIFRLNGIFGIFGKDIEYGGELERLLGGFGDILEFVKSCYDEEDKAYYMFHPSYLKRNSGAGSLTVGIAPKPISSQ